MSATSPRFATDSTAPSTPGSPSPNWGSFPFPRQQSSASVYRSRRESTASVSSVGTVGSIGGTLNSGPRRESSIREIGQNAISTLIQPPIVRTGLVPHTQASAAATGYRAPTTRDIPPVALTNVPHVPPESFRDYLSRIAPLFESFQRGRAEPEQPSWLKKDKELERTDRFAEQLERKLSRDGSSSPVLTHHPSPAILSPLDSPGGFRRRSSGQIRRNRNEPTPLSTIPNVYFDEDFHLENPRTFDVVSERAEIVRPVPGTPVAEHKAANGSPLPPRKALATNAILQEKLSWYMDTVEVHLINSISTASSGFFAALGSLKELQLEAEQSVAKIQSLREDLRRLDQEVAVSGLEVAAKRRRRDNVRKLGKATAQLHRMVQNVQKADELVDNGAYDEAADQMDRVARLICGESQAGDDSEELIDLRPLKALQGLDSGLQGLQLRIGAGFAQGFTQTLMDDIRQHVEKVASSDTLKRLSKQRGIPPVYMEGSEQLRKNLQVSLKGLSRAGHTASATTAYRESVNKEMKSLIRQFLPSSSDDDADSMISTSTRGGKQLNQQDKTTILARNLRALDAEDAEKLLIGVYTTIGEALRRVSTQTKILLDVTSSMQAAESKALPKSPLRSPNLPAVNENGERDPLSAANLASQDDLSQALDMSSLLGQAVDTAQSQITKVLKVRNEQSIRLSRQHFLRYFTLNRLFADECEAISGRGGNALRGIINAQISGFVQVLGTADAERVAAVLDSDSWNAADFSDKDNKSLQRILAAANSDPAEWSANATPIWESSSTSTQTNGTPATDSNGTEVAPSTNGTTTAKPPSRPAHIEDTKFVLVASAISLLPSISDFLSLTVTLPSMTTQIATSLLDVLKTFNSRSCQLILGAGAMRSIGLKNITTKHLSLASQALSFVIALIPYMRECVRRHIPSGQNAILAEFDKTKRLYQDHQMGIHDKVVEIITSRSLGHAKAMRAIDFSAAPAAPSGYVETLTSETSILHRVLSRHLSETDIGIIMRQIFTAYKEHFSKAFEEVEVKNEEAKSRLLQDAEAFESKLGKLEKFGDVGREVVRIAKARTVGVGGGGGQERSEK